MPPIDADRSPAVSSCPQIRDRLADSRALGPATRSMPTRSMPPAQCPAPDQSRGGRAAEAFDPSCASGSGQGAPVRRLAIASHGRPWANDVGTRACENGPWPAAARERRPAMHQVVQPGCTKCSRREVAPLRCLACKAPLALLQRRNRSCNARLAGPPSLLGTGGPAPWSSPLGDGWWVGVQDGRDPTQRLARVRRHRGRSSRRLHHRPGMNKLAPWSSWRRQAAMSLRRRRLTDD